MISKKYFKFSLHIGVRIITEGQYNPAKLLHPFSALAKFILQ